MQDFIANNLDAYGPFAVFLLLMLSGFGMSLAEDLIVIPAGALVAHGQLDLWPTLAAAYFGVVVSDSMWFGLCWRYGTRLLHLRALKRLVHPRRLLEAKHQMERRGAWMIVMARFLPGSRTTAITVAGSLHMPFQKFILATAGSALVTAPLQFAIGYFSVKIMGVEDTAGMVQLIVGLLVLALALMSFLALWRRHKARAVRAPRARARWLRRFRLPRVRRPAQGRGMQDAIE